MYRSRKPPSLLVLLTPAVLLVWTLDFWDGTVPGSQESPAESRVGARTLVRKTSEAEIPETGRRSSSPEGGKLERRSPIVPPSSATKHRPDTASSGWVGDVYLRISGNESFTDHQILGTLDLPQNDDARQLKQTIEGQIRTFYRDQGFARARVRAVLNGSDPFICDVEIREGRVLYYAGLELVGLSAISPREAASFYPPVGGLVDWNQFRDANISLREKYHEMGFAGVIISGKAIVAHSSSLLRYRVRVVERVQYRVGSVSIPSDLVAQFPLRSGEVFASSLLDGFVRESGVSEDRVLVAQNPRDALTQITILE